MTLKLDANTNKKLVLVKQLYQQAVLWSSGRQSVMNRILAVITFDLSVETAIRTANRALSDKKQDEIGFPRLIQATNHLLVSAGLAEIPDVANISHVHKIRNDAQHNARYPSALEVEDCRIYVRDFLRKFVDQVWGVHVDGISTAAFIEDEFARGLLEKAEQHLSKKDYAEAVRLASAGLKWVFDQAPRDMIGDAFRWSFDLRHGSSLRHGARRFRVGKQTGTESVVLSLQEDTAESFREVWEALSQMWQELSKEFDRVQDSVLCLSLGLNPTELLRFRRIAGRAYFRPNEQRIDYYVIDMKEEPTATEAEFVVLYAIDSAIQIESRAKVAPRSDRLTA